MENKSALSKLPQNHSHTLKICETVRPDQIINAMLLKVRDSVNLQFNMDGKQVAECAIEIAKDYPDMLMSELESCLQNGRKGKYGELYNRLDMSVIFTWIRKFEEQRPTGYEDMIGYKDKLHRNTEEFSVMVRPSGKCLVYNRK